MQAILFPLDIAAGAAHAAGGRLESVGPAGRWRFNLGADSAEDACDAFLETLAESYADAHEIDEDTAWHELSHAATWDETGITLSRFSLE